MYSFERIVGDLGTKKFESINPGLFYTLLSGATKFGEEKKKPKQHLFDTKQTI